MEKFLNRFLFAVFPSCMELSNKLKYKKAINVHVSSQAIMIFYEFSSILTFERTTEQLCLLRSSCSTLFKLHNPKECGASVLRASVPLSVSETRPQF